MLRVLLIAFVVLVHGALLLLWNSTPATHLAKPLMTVSLQETAPAAAPAPPVKIPNSHQSAPTVYLPSVVATPTDMPLIETSQSLSTLAPLLATSLASPPAAESALADREPDYQASYLNNPKPIYPNVAARMGWHGTVVLNVEVLATGFAGQVSVQRSSGHEVLDDAALQAIRRWQFVPARHQGQLITQYFLVPIPFVLKDYDE